jgi:phenylpropionate dioxygenase-like ring-hydroxylating dioxygenase large terminal subunit
MTRAERRVPASRYTEPRFLAREAERLWPRVWICAAHVSELAEPGRFITFELGRESFLIVRGESGEPRAFHNVCAHRMNRLCEPASGHAVRFRCAYHGWEYGADGRLLRAPRSEQFEAPLPRGLAELRCETRLGFVWIAATGEAGSIDDFLAPIAPFVAPFHPEAMAIRGAATVEIACNWKLSADVSNEAYHLRTLHPDLLQLLDDTRVSLSLHGMHSRYVIPFGLAAPGSPYEGTIGPLLGEYLRSHGIQPASIQSPAGVRRVLARSVRERASAQGIDLTGLDDDALVDKHQVYIFPNLQLNFAATSLELYRHRPHATDPEITFFDEVKLERLAAGKRAAPPSWQRFRHGEAPLGPVMGQDVDLLPKLQRGLRSSAFSGILLGGDEAAIRHMHAHLSRLLFDSDDPTFDAP